MAQGNNLIAGSTAQFVRVDDPECAKQHTSGQVSERKVCLAEQSVYPAAGCAWLGLTQVSDT